MSERAVVILSGGLDSTTCAAIAARDNEQLICLTFDYGQRHRRELESAAHVASRYGAEHLVVAFDARQWGGSALTDEIEVPKGRELDDAIPVTYVPARNTIFLALALAVAEARDADRIYIGVNALDYSGYPDCRPEYIAAFRAMANLAQKRAVEGRPIAIEAPLIELTKADIIRLGVELDAPLGLSWSCYEGGERPCGECDSCVLRAKGFAVVGMADPALSGALA
jgi:7-cyano-7-deazaguanine synthase